MIFELLLGIICLTLLAAFWYSKRPSNFPPGPRGLPIFGNSLSIPLYDVHLILEEWKLKYGPVIGVMMGQQSGMFVTGAEPVVAALKKEEFQGRPDTAYVRDRSYGERLGIFFSDGQQWFESRKITVRYLREFNKDNHMEDLLQKEIDEFLQTRVDADTPMQMSGFFHHAVLNIIWLFLIGKRFSFFDKSYVKFLHNCEDSFRLGVLAGSSVTDSFPILKKTVAKYRNINENVFDFIHEVRNIIKGCIEDTKANSHDTAVSSADAQYFVDFYLKEMNRKSGMGVNETLSENDLTLICLDFVAATINSVNSILEFCVMYLILNPPVQDKLHQELDQVLGSRKINFSTDKNDLHYMNAVLNEVIRINTIAPMTATHRSVEDTQFYGYKIPKDTLIFVSIWSIFYDDSVFPAPNLFNPDRFLNIDTNQLDRVQMFLPFGTGKRICPGDMLTKQILLIYLSNFLQKYSVHEVPQDPTPDTRAQAGFVNSPKPFRVIIKERH